MAQSKIRLCEAESGVLDGRFRPTSRERGCLTKMDRSSFSPDIVRSDERYTYSQGHLAHRKPIPATAMTEQREQQAFLGTAYDDALPKQRSAPSTRRSCLDLIAAWWIEIISLLVGVGALVAIAVTLAEYNSKEQPAWKYSVNLNTLIAILSTLLRVCMLYGVEEGTDHL